MENRGAKMAVGGQGSLQAAGREKKKRAGELALDLLMELVGNILIAAATCNVAINGGFPLSGFSGIAMLIYRMTGFPIGRMVLILNIVPALLCLKIIGKRFVGRTCRCMVMSLILTDYIMPRFPSYDGDRILAALVTGVLFGVGYALIYSRGSSTGGADFIMILVKKYLPHVKTGTINFVMDAGVVMVSGMICGDVDGIVLGLVINYLMNTVIDKMILGMNSGNVALIVTDRKEDVVQCVFEVSERGCTILKGEGGYGRTERDVVMVAGSNRDIYNIRKAVRELDPGSFVIIMASNEVNGEGFHVTRVGE